MSTPSRYHPFLVALHWLLALMLLVALFMGSTVLENTPNSDPNKLFSLKAHMSAGMAIGVLMLIRLFVRWKTAKPAAATTGMAWADALAKPMHAVLYVLVFAMVASGMGIALLAGLPDIVFGGVGTLPENFRNLPPRAVHGVVAKLLMLAIAAHLAAALYHQFVRKDGLLSRMGLGRGR